MAGVPPWHRSTSPGCPGPLPSAGNSPSPVGEPVRWSHEAQEVISGDITTAAAYLAPAGGAVVTAVATSGIADRDRGMAGFTQGLGIVA